MTRLLSVALLVLGLTAGGQASPQGDRPPEVLSIEGMEPMSAADLTRFTGLAVRLAATARTDPRVEPMLTETLSQSDRGIVKRAVAYLALCAMHREDTARKLTGTTFRDHAMMKLVHACLAVQENLTLVPER